jgi:hypothetical protein
MVAFLRNHELHGPAFNATDSVRPTTGHPQPMLRPVPEADRARLDATFREPFLLETDHEQHHLLARVFSPRAC